MTPATRTALNRITALGMDIGGDPLSYVGGGATRVVEKASDAARALQAAEEAQVAIRIAEKTGDAERVAAATARAQALADEAARVATLPNADVARRVNIPTPRNRAERANLMGELTETPGGQRFLNEMPDQAVRGGMRGFQEMSPEARAIVGISIRGCVCAASTPSSPAPAPSRRGSTGRAERSAKPSLGPRARVVGRTSAPPEDWKSRTAS